MKPLEVQDQASIKYRDAAAGEAFDKVARMLGLKAILADQLSKS